MDWDAAAAQLRLERSERKAAQRVECTAADPTFFPSSTAGRVCLLVTYVYNLSQGVCDGEEGMGEQSKGGK